MSYVDDKLAQRDAENLLKTEAKDRKAGKSIQSPFWKSSDSNEVEKKSHDASPKKRRSA